MIRTTSAIVLVLCFFACHQSQPRTAAAADAGIPDVLADNMKGMYVGQYSKGMLRLMINYISGNTASGYDIHKGLRRNINGQVERKGGQLLFVLKEPGGNPYDGTFFLTLDTLSQKITGRWLPTDSTKAHAGELHLSRLRDAAVEDVADSWEGELGDLAFYPDGTVSLQYYVTPGENAQLVTVHGNYEHQGDTFRIEWQRNSRTPVLKMKLIAKPMISGTDSTETIPLRLEGGGVRFSKSMAG